ncbi:MAG: hypothetical protein AAGL24_12580 [Pseudomonadota bacterium]
MTKTTLTLGRTAAVAGLVLIVATTGGLAQSRMNVAPQNIAPGNVGPNNIGPGPGPGGGCLSTTLAGNTYMRICPTSYSANANGTSCSGSVSAVGGGYNLRRGSCNVWGQQFLGGRLSCNGGNTCQWTPSPAGRQQGYFAEQVYVSYQ